MRKIILILLVLIALPCYARTVPAVGSVEGDILHTIQTAWEIADTTTSAGEEPNALAVTERTKLTVDAAAEGGDAEISTFTLPSEWNGIRLRAIGITDGATVTHQIYFGSLGGDDDCELTHAGQLAWTIGTQQSIYDQITFVNGGCGAEEDCNLASSTFVPKPDLTVTGATSGETAVIVSISLSSGAWADGDAAGTVTYRSASGAFTSSELIKGDTSLGVTDPNIYVHAASDLVDFELADTVVVTAGAWGSSWTSTSPANNTVAEAEIDIKGADYMVIVTTTSTVDSKLLIKGY